MIKRIATLLWAYFVLLLIASGCRATPAYSSTPTNVPIDMPVIFPFSYKPVVPATNISGDGTNPDIREEIARKLTIAWLDYYTSEDLPSKVRLQEYFIISVVVPDEWQICLLDPKKEFRAEIRFGAKLSEILYNPWYAGGGDTSEDHWWIIRTEYPLIIREGDTYTLVFDGFNYCHTPVP